MTCTTIFERGTNFAAFAKLRAFTRFASVHVKTAGVTGPPACERVYLLEFR